MSRKLTLDEFPDGTSGRLFLSHAEMEDRGIKVLDVLYLIGRKSKQIGRGLLTKQLHSNGGITFRWGPVPFEKKDSID